MQLMPSLIKINPACQVRILWREVVIITVVLFAQLLGGSVPALTYLALSIWALRSPKHAIEALSISWLITFLNPGIFFEGGTIFRWLVLFAAFSRVITSKIMRTPRISREIVCLALFILFAAWVSILKSYTPVVSLFKLVAFAVGVATVLLAFKLSEDQKVYWIAWFTTFFLLILVIGFPLYFFGLGYVRNGKGFQGLLNHPQAYAVFLAPMVAWFTGRFLFEKNKSIPIVIGVLLGWISLFATLSRTGILAVVLGAGLTVIIGVMKKAEWRNTLVRTFNTYKRIIGLCLLCLFLVLNWQPLSQKTRNFLQKETEAKNFANVYNMSRGVFIAQSMKNFLANPWTGIGFGLASDPYSMSVKIDKWLGLPVGASVEKGFFLTAVLEEVGVLGAGLLLAFMFALILPILKWGNLPALWLFITSFLVNMGEMVFFSFGGMGLYIWLMFGFSRSLLE